MPVFTKQVTTDAGESIGLTRTTDVPVEIRALTADGWTQEEDPAPEAKPAQAKPPAGKPAAQPAQTSDKN
ncbi:hypothetical protein [Actinomyces bowdenii]|uniref:Uncharacterized protein n=1 Tax=Actinomyces bowdenii TaxID=131109 RepID=A0A853EJT3_9ACTO|nr:hypothetical protein [Actinomyces bowdenii]MBF0696128.1 hypothetical protein [Actinomyces bowdenii]NYS68301.1 hypothetical protein [Actinomyces bowdenii]